MASTPGRRHNDVSFGNIRERMSSGNSVSDASGSNYIIQFYTEACMNVIFEEISHFLRGNFSNVLMS